MSSTVDVEKSTRPPPDRIDEWQREGHSCTGEPLRQTPSRGHVADVFSKTLSRVRTRDDLDPGPPPDGGARAWLTSCAAHLVIFNSWGFINSFGLFQTFYVEVMKIGGPSTVAWIGTTQVFVLFGMGTFTGRGLDAGFFKLQYIVGSVTYLVGMFMLSLCREYWQIFLAQAVCIGIGYGLVFVPTLALVSTYFLEKRSTGLAIAVAGSATGGLVFPAIAAQMLPAAGFAWTIRTMAFVQMTLAIISGAYLKPRLPPRKSGPLVEWAAFREAPYSLYCIASFLYFWSVYIGFFFIGSYAKTVLGASQSTGINILLVLNGVGFPGRVIPAYVAQRWTGSLNLMTVSVAAAGIILYCWTAVRSLTGLWIFAVVYGVAAASLQALFPVVLTSLTVDPKKAGVRAGMGFSMMGVAVLTGSPIAGALIERDGGGYLGLQLFSATSMIASAMVLVCVRVAAVGWTWAKI